MGGPPGGSMVGQMVTSSKRTHATRCASQDCCCQSPCPCGWPLLTHVSAGDPQTLISRTVGITAPFSESSCTQGFVCALHVTLVCMKFDFKCSFVHLAVLLQLLLCHWSWGIFFGGFQNSPVDGCSAASCDFVLKEHECTSFYSVILIQYVVVSRCFNIYFPDWHDVEHLFIAYLPFICSCECVYFLCVCVIEMSVKMFGSFFWSGCLFSCWILRVLCVYLFLTVLYEMCFVQIFSPSLWFVF